MVPLKMLGKWSRGRGVVVTPGIAFRRFSPVSFPSQVHLSFWTARKVLLDCIVSQKKMCVKQAFRSTALKIGKILKRDTTGHRHMEVLEKNPPPPHLMTTVVEKFHREEPTCSVGGEFPHDYTLNQCSGLKCFMSRWWLFELMTVEKEKTDTFEWWL